MTIKDFIELLNKNDLDKDFCLYDISNGNRYIIKKEDIDFELRDIVDVNFRGVN